MGVDYEKQAERYSFTRGIEPLVYTVLSHLLRPEEGDVVLDFGCGTGNYLQRLVSDYHIDPYGVEPSESMRKSAQEKLPPDHIRAGNHMHIPFSVLFNKIFITDVVHHIDQVDIMFQNLLQIALPGAKFCICTESAQQLAEKYWNRYFPDALDADLHRFHSIDKIIKMGQSCGWVYKKTISTEDEQIAPISPTFMARVEERTLSVLHLISDEAYYQGLLHMKGDFQNKILIPQREGYTFVLFEKGQTNEI